MARKNNAPTPSDLSQLAALLRQERPQPTALKLDEIKRDVLDGARRPRRSRVATSLRRRVLAASLAVCLFGISTSNAAASLLNWASGGSFGSKTLGYGKDSKGVQFFFGSFGFGGDHSDNAGHHTYCPDDKDSDHSHSDRSDDKSDDNDKSSNDNSDRDKYSDDRDGSSEDHSDGGGYKTSSYSSSSSKSGSYGGGHHGGGDDHSDHSDKSTDKSSDRDCPTDDHDHSDNSHSDRSDDKSDKSDDNDKSSNDNSDRDKYSDDRDGHSSEDHSD
jgi:hypothetical protein